MKLINKVNKVIGFRGTTILPGETIEVADKDCTENSTIALLIKKGYLEKCNAVKPVKADSSKASDSKPTDSKDKV